MKQFIFILIVCCMAVTGKTQYINWQDTHDWKLYQITDNNAFYYPIDTLKQFKHVDLNESLLKSMLVGATPDTTKDKPVWMGYYVISFIDQAGETHKLEVSMYAGFFYEHKTRQYYHVTEENRRKWLDFMNQSANQLPPYVTKRN